MPVAVDVIAIVSPKNATQKWIINRDNFDAATMVRWEERESSQAIADDPAPPAPPVQPEEAVQEDTIVVRNPEDRRQRLTIPKKDYEMNPTDWELWPAARE
jgi:hypothetical protein